MDNIYTNLLHTLNYNLSSAQYGIDHSYDYFGIPWDYKSKDIIMQAETHPKINFRANLLIVGDRLYSVALGLHYYMHCCTDATAIVVLNEQEAEIAINRGPFDFLIFVGYQRDEGNYNIISKLGEGGFKNLIFWASPDRLIYSLYRKHRMHYIFDRNKPLNIFVDFLRSLQKK